MKVLINAYLFDSNGFALCLNVPTEISQFYVGYEDALATAYHGEDVLSPGECRLF